ncbi:hypothetical protein SpCBS45565_g01238 [Spizellomyces sp. 'palustris']|nr:hypothetical protein SpCBS45565_g01238 [Spizellomyces sp. 'palustris']
MLQGGATDLRQLLERSRQLTVHINPSDVPQLERGLDQIKAESKRLYKRTTRVAEPGTTSAGPSGPAGMDPRTAILLANKGFDPDKVRQNLDQIDLAQSFEPLHAVRDTDIEGYLNNEYENIVTVAIHETKRETDKAFDNAFEKLLYRDWERARKKVFQELGAHSAPWGTPDHSGAQVGGFRVDQSIGPRRAGVPGLGAGPGAGTDTSGTESGMGMHPRLGAYFKVVREINQRRLAGQNVDVIIAFFEAAQTLATNDTSQRMLARCWTLLYRMLGGDLDFARDPNRPLLEPRQFAGIVANPATAVEFRQKIAKGARAWLEDNYRSWVSDFVRRQHAAVGGNPTVHSEVKAMLEMRFCRNTGWMRGLRLVHGHPFWAHVFTLVRCGLIQEASQHIDQHADFLKTAAPYFAAYFKAWAQDPSGRLARELRNRLLQEWNAHLRDHDNDPDVDPFQLALYKIIGRCDVSIKTIRNSNVIGSAEDYMWLQFMLAKEQVLETDALQERYTLRDVSLKVRHFGLDHFKNPVIWFQMLLLCGDFELAISELLKQEAFSVDALHFAIAMVYYGVLRVPKNPNELQDGNMLIVAEQVSLPSKTAYTVYNFNVAQLIGAFVGDLGRSDPIAALQYVFFLGLLGEPLTHQDMQLAWGQRAQSASSQGGPQYTTFAHRLIRDVALASKDFEKLLGEAGPTGNHVPGEAERYRSLLHIRDAEEFKLYITIPSAEQAERAGRFQDALRLYYLAGEHGRVIELLSRQLSDRLIAHRYRDDVDSISRDDHSGQITDVFVRVGDPVELAQQLLDFYKSNPQMLGRITIEARQTCELLTRLMRFMQLCDRTAYDAALPLLLQTGLVPTNVNEVHAKANAFRLVSDLVSKTMSDVLIAACTAISHIHQTLTMQRVTAGQAPGRDRHLAELKELAAALTMYAGQLQYRIPSETLSIMNKLFVNM